MKKSFSFVRRTGRTGEAAFSVEFDRIPAVGLGADHFLADNAPALTTAHRTALVLGLPAGAVLEGLLLILARVNGHQGVGARLILNDRFESPDTMFRCTLIDDVDLKWTKTEIQTQSINQPTFKESISLK